MEKLRAELAPVERGRVRKFWDVPREGIMQRSALELGSPPFFLIFMILCTLFATEERGLEICYNQSCKPIQEGACQ